MVQNEISSSRLWPSLQIILVRCYSFQHMLRYFESILSASRYNTDTFPREKELQVVGLCIRAVLPSCSDCLARNLGAVRYNSGRKRDVALLIPISVVRSSHTPYTCSTLCRALGPISDQRSRSECKQPDTPESHHKHTSLLLDH